MKKVLLHACLFLLLCASMQAQQILLPMGEKQENHLKAYGIVYWVLEQNTEAYWLLNYRGGSFAFEYDKSFQLECVLRGVTHEVIDNTTFNEILSDINDPEVNMEAIKLDNPPKIAVYSPKVDAKGKEIQPWQDAVMQALVYAEIPYDLVYDSEVLRGALAQYDWLHLHHDDFTGQYGKFYRTYSNWRWYLEHTRVMETLAKKHGFKKVSQLKLAVAKKIKEYVANGGYMFAMCAATDTYDIALAADGVDICDRVYDGDPPDANAQSKLNYENTLAFKDFNLITDPLVYEHSDIDNSQHIKPERQIKESLDYFSLYEFSAKWDPIAAMLTQCHIRTIKGFMGQTTAFRRMYIKDNVKILAETKPLNEAKYLHGTFGEGFWSFYGGHDPEDYHHFITDPLTDLTLHPNSAGYRLILNNILFPAAKKKHRPI